MFVNKLLIPFVVKHSTNMKQKLRYKFLLYATNAVLIFL